MVAVLSRRRTAGPTTPSRDMPFTFSNAITESKSSWP